MNNSTSFSVAWQWYKDTMMSWLEDPGVEDHQGLNMSALMMDQAYMTGVADRNVGVYSVSDDCFRCPFELQKSLSAGFESWWVVETARRSTLRVYKHAADDYISWVDMSAEAESGRVWSIHPKPILLVLGVLLGVWVIYGLLKMIMSRVRRSAKLRYGDKELAIQQRLRALDTFRGMAIVFMIFVNDGAGGYWWLEHATWNGLAAGDLVFPAFLWIMGVCVPLSVKSAFAKGIPRWKIVIHILRGACGQALKDVLSCMWCWVLAGLLIALHTAVTFIVHHPDCPPGYLGPGGKHDDWVAPECSGGAAGYIDRLLLGDSHLYQNSDARRVYGGSITDPEGLLVSLTILSICYTFTDAWRLWAGGPFRAPGLNAIALYVGHSVCAHLFPFHWRLPVMRTHSVRLVEAVWGTALWVIIAHIMARKKCLIPYRVQCKHTLCDFVNTYDDLWKKLNSDLQNNYIDVALLFICVVQIF
ncbi:unnamed protein product [Leptidea sinapis]|uniref:Uncharacterized protein n=1 Tax=Leptidea sinapis TaxID=189913 RepID=A0A5E4RAB5_9NEOP|nr:unnamed protein product [Leptidea sinapis]